MKYICAKCKNKYDLIPELDELAKKESFDIWGEIPTGQFEVVCDDCFKLMFPDEKQLRLIGNDYKFGSKKRKLGL